MPMVKLLLASVATLFLAINPIQAQKEDVKTSASDGVLQSKTNKVMVGQVIIVGNERTPDSEIRKQLDMYPGQVLRYPSIRIAEERLAKLGIFVVDTAKGIHPAITVLDPDSDRLYRDILVIV